ncbi:hypothetical protein T11_4681, partial [Trichinella zimbabwensis]
LNKCTKRKEIKIATCLASMKSKWDKKDDEKHVIP